MEWVQNVQKALYFVWNTVDLFLFTKSNMDFLMNSELTYNLIGNLMI